MVHHTALLLVLLGAVLFVPSIAQASLVNGDFETGDFTGWSTFTTLNGAISGNQPAGVYLFDVDGDGNFSLSARFQVGLRSFFSGGGIFQTVTSSVPFSIEADIAASSSGNNASGGFFELIVDDIVHDYHDFGSISVGEIKRSVLNSSIFPAGSYELRLRMTRPFGTGATPLQYIDDVVLIPVPEPTSAASTLLTVLVMLYFARGTSTTFHSLNNR